MCHNGNQIFVSFDNNTEGQVSTGGIHLEMEQKVILMSIVNFRQIHAIIILLFE